MIVIEKGPNCITVTGHAQYAEMGKDIVCAGVSVLVQTLVQALEDLTDAKFNYEMAAGHAEINFELLPSRARLLVKAFFVGIEMLASEYPYHVKLTKR